ncbi:trophoblast glyco -like [Pelobates cultripes]|uniref:Trophoblast glyco -like n=1 Tax=Pelobates cultripes TaxID=61616 RepID=A0AAD1R8N4_PELCU|nr:trophoblast glyco -like [Pelobates cultripes]
MSGRQPHFYGNLTVFLLSAKANCILIFKLIGLLNLLNVTVSCPLKCSCIQETGFMQCHFLQGIPKDIPHWVQNLSVNGSNITTLQAATFRSNGTQLSNLTTLVLTNNKIRTIESLAFHELPNLITLDLSYNVLHHISNNAFVGLTHLKVLRLNQAFWGADTKLTNMRWLKNVKSLRTLEIFGNGLQSFPSGLLEIENLQFLNIGNNSIKMFDKMTVLWFKRLNIWVYLSPNPLVCDCKLSEMISWLRNTTQVLDAQNLLCFAPENLNGTRVNNLELDSFKCLNENLETASYVFFGIVLALIGLIFLMVLYLNRRGIKKWLNNFREACRDQMEGYHYRYEQDTDPRRSNAATGI